MCSCRVPVGDVSVADAQMAQLTVDTSAGLGDVHVEGVTASAVRIRAGEPRLDAGRPIRPRSAAAHAGRLVHA